MPTIDAIKQWFIYLGISVPALVMILILALYLYPHARVFLGDVLRAFGWTGKWIRRKSVDFEIEGTINFFLQIH